MSLHLGRPAAPGQHRLEKVALLVAQPGSVIVKQPFGSGLVILEGIDVAQNARSFSAIG